MLALMEVESVYRLAHAMTLDADAAEKLVAGVYRRALENPPVEMPARDVRRWLLRILVQSHAAQQAAPTHGSPAQRCPPAAEKPAPIQPLRPGTETSDWFVQALPGMTFHCRAVIVLWAIEGLTYRQIGQIMDIPVGTVTVWLNRARNYLARKQAEAQRPSAAD